MADVADIEFAPEWQLAQIKMLETSTLQSLDGLTCTDEDYVDSWEAAIPTKIKLRFKIQNKRGEEIDFITEWDRLQGTINVNERQVDMRRRILAKKQLIIDVLDEVKAWMKIHYDTIPDAEGAMYQKFGVKDNAGSESYP